MIEKKPPVKFRINTAGFKGEPVSLFGAFDPDSNMLVISQDQPYSGGEPINLKTKQSLRADFLLLTNQSTDTVHDALFLEEDTADAIKAFFSLQDMRLLKLNDAVSRHSPLHMIERAGMDEHGVKYRLSPDITNGQVAVLIAAHYATLQRAVASMEDFDLILDGEISVDDEDDFIF